MKGYRSQRPADPALIYNPVSNARTYDRLATVAAAEKPVKEPKEKAAKKPSRKKVAKEARMKAYWGVFNPSMKRLVLFEYADKKAADKKAADLTNTSKSQHFVQLVKEAITE